jgi:hypothetical protein
MPPVSGTGASFMAASLPSGRPIKGESRVAAPRAVPLPVAPAADY